MEGIDVVSNCLAAIRKHPIFLVPELVLTIFAALLAFALIVPLTASIIGQSSSLNATISPAVAIATIVQLIPNFIILIVIVAVASLILEAMYIVLVSKWNESTASLTDAFSIALSRFFDLFLYSLLILVIEGVIALILFAPSISTLAPLISNPSLATTNMWAQFLLGAIGSILIGVLIGIILAPLLFTGATIVVLEKLGPIKAFMASIEIGKKDFVGILGVYLIFIITYIIIYVISVVLGLIPYIGAIFTLALSILLGTFAYLIAPMYYVTFARQNNAKAQPAQKPVTRRSKK